MKMIDAIEAGDRGRRYCVLLFRNIESKVYDKVPDR
jgi:hypothetical protein